jgi:microcystin-dependent protein
MSDEMGEYLSERPCVEIPYKKNFQQDGTGNFILDENGDPIEGPVPCFDSIVVSDPCGCQNRIQGLPGVLQDIEWNGSEFCMKEQTVRDNNPLIDPKDVPVVDTLCPAPLHAILIPTTEQIYVNGEEETVQGYKIGGTYETGIPAGTMQMWAGAFTAVPEGWLLCDGASYDTVDQAELFAAIGYLWGGLGSNFNVPDMRGRFARGTDLGAGNDPDADARLESAPGSNTGDNVGSLQGDQMQCFGAEYLRYNVQCTSVKQTTGHGNNKTVAACSNQYSTVPIAFVENGCGEPRFGSETRPENVYVNYIIRAGCPPTD